MDIDLERCVGPVGEGWRLVDRVRARTAEDAFHASVHLGSRWILEVGTREVEVQGWYALLAAWPAEGGSFVVREWFSGQRLEFAFVVGPDRLEALVRATGALTHCRTDELTTPQVREADRVQGMARALGMDAGPGVIRVARTEDGPWIIERAWRGFPRWVCRALEHGIDLPAASLNVLRATSAFPARLEPGREGIEGHGKGAADEASGDASSLVAAHRGRDEPVVDARTAVLDRWVAERPAAGLEPMQVRFDAVLHEQVDASCALAETLIERVGLPLAIAASVKTNPNPGWLRLARQRGLLAECISLAEVDHALSLGFDPGKIILNGPGKWWPPDPQSSCRELGMVLADSVGDLERSVRLVIRGRVRTPLLGVRIRPTCAPSRFGLRLEDSHVLEQVADLLADAPEGTGLAAHMHVALTWVGERTWLAAATSAVRSAAELQDAVGRPVRVLDLGGGWPPERWDITRECLVAVAEMGRNHLPALERLVIEPGRSLTQAGFATLMRVVDVDKQDGQRDVVLSGSYWDCPDVQMFPHDVLWSPAGGGSWFRLPDGPDRLLGRLCMETDVLKHRVALPDRIREGDAVAITGTGGYDASLSRPFGTGLSRW
jgi:diaminopimelate decarboxylase